MTAAITFGNVLVVDRCIMTAHDGNLATILQDNKQLIHTTLMNLWASSKHANPNATITKPSLWVMYLGPREQVILFTSPDSEHETFRHKYEITPQFREFWDIIQAAGYHPEVRCASMFEKTGAFLLLREAA